MTDKKIHDQLVLYRGHTHKITENIAIHIPTLEEICAYGEADYYSMVHTLCCVGIDLCWQLEEIGIPFDTITDYELFYTVLCKRYRSEQTKILFGEKLNFAAMTQYLDPQTNLVCLQQEIPTSQGATETITITEDIYYEIVKYLRAIHNLKRDDRVAGTKSCRSAFIEDAKAEYEAMLAQPKSSYLLPLISTLVNYDGFKRNDQNIWDMNIFAFMDSIKRIDKIRNANLLLQSGYSGFGIDLKKVNKEELNYLGDLH